MASLRKYSIIALVGVSGISGLAGYMAGSYSRQDAQASRAYEAWERLPRAAKQELIAKELGARTDVPPEGRDDNVARMLKRYLED